MWKRWIFYIIRGARDTREQFRQNEAGSLVWLLLASVSTSAVQYYALGENAMMEEVSIVLSGAAGATIVVVLALCWNIARAPFRVRADPAIYCRRRPIGTSVGKFEAEGERLRFTALNLSEELVAGSIYQFQEKRIRFIKLERETSLTIGGIPQVRSAQGAVFELVR